MTATLPRTEERATTASAPYNLPLGYLRAFITLLVVAHHAVLAYMPLAPPPPAALNGPSPWWRAFPVVDPHRWNGFLYFVAFNDLFFMSLMFFLSGLFVWGSLERKGRSRYLRDRLLRLGVPFLAVAALVGPLAYYPAYLQTGSTNGFWRQWLSLSDWPAGPAWFVWVLLAFGAVAALLHRVIPNGMRETGRWLSSVARRPVLFFGILVLASAAAYIPMSKAFNPLRWSAFGPFTFQTSRIVHYLVYFLAGVCLGAVGTDLFSPKGRLARRWALWAVGALVAFVSLAVLGDNGFALSCAASCFAFLALFARFARSQSAWFDSLRDNAYGIYLLHYAFVSWLQFELLRVSLPAVAKGALVTAGAIALSWAATAALRRIPLVARVI